MTFGPDALKAIEDELRKESSEEHSKFYMDLTALDEHAQELNFGQFTPFVSWLKQICEKTKAS